MLAKQDITGLRQELSEYRAKNSRQCRTTDEHLITFKQLEEYLLVMQQQDWPLHWNDVDGLYSFPSSIPGYIINLDVFSHWSTVATKDERAQQPFLHHDTPNILECQALFLALAPLRLAETTSGAVGLPHGDDPREFVFLATTVFVHPDQRLSSITNGVDTLLSRFDLVVEDPHLDGWGILCLLPHYNMGTVYPCMSHSNYLVLPVEVTGKDSTPTLRLDSPDHVCRSFIVHKLHQQKQMDGLVAILPPCFGQDPNSTAEFFIQTKARLWRNTDYTAPLLPGGTTSKECPVISQVTTSQLETDEGEMVALIHLPQFTRYEPTIPDRSEPEKVEPENPFEPDNPTEPANPPESKDRKVMFFDDGSAHGDSGDSGNDSEGNLVENHKRTLNLSELDVSLELIERRRMLRSITSYSTVRQGSTR